LAEKWIMFSGRSSLLELRADFRATSTESMPIAGIFFWSTIAILGLYLVPARLAYVVGFGSGLIFPLAVLIDRMRGRTLMATGRSNPLTGMFLQTLVMVALLWPLVIIAASGGCVEPPEDQPAPYAVRTAAR
jgi:hypothetical protein